MSADTPRSQAAAARRCFRRARNVRTGVQLLLHVDEGMRVSWVQPSPLRGGTGSQQTGATTASVTATPPSPPVQVQMLSRALS